MCGIAGGVSKNLKNNEFKNILNSIKHRGPDGEGIFIDEKNNLFLGHRRLSIIDLSDKASQPMRIITKNKRELVMIFNGEIYNYKEIRKELEVLGCEFFSSSDTEVILNSYAQWGVECVKKFRGMFAFAIWDVGVQELIIFRDRFGVKPLHYYLNNNDFVFASELKAIYQFPGVKKEIDFQALGNYFQFGYISAPKTIFKNIYKLEAGYYLRLKINEGKIVNFEKKQYWSAESVWPKDSINQGVSVSEGDLLNELEGVLLESFRYRMVADVDVGVFLSGGVDSSLVATLLQKNSPSKIKTFTVGFKDEKYNEAPFAKEVSNRLGTDHYEYYLDENDLESALSSYVDIFDEPFGDSSSLPTYILSKNTKEEVKVALSGDGGDELFFGYSKYWAVLNILKNPKVFNLASSYLIKAIGPKMAARFYSLVFGSSKQSNLVGKLYKLSNSLSGHNLLQIFALASSYWQEKEISRLFVGGEKWDNRERNYLDNEKFDTRSQMQLWDIKNYLCDDILVKTDRATMANGLEAREPFLDEKILKFFASAPNDVKYKEPKYLLKQILYKHLPKELFDRPKTGFQPPIINLLNKNWNNYYREFLSNDIIKKQGIFNPDIISRMVSKYKNGDYVNPEKLWLLVAFQMWYEKWIEN